MKSINYFGIVKVAFVLVVMMMGLVLFDTFKSDFYIFQGGLGIIAVVLGIFGIVMDLVNRYISSRLMAMSSVFMLIFCILYSIVSPETKIIFVVLGIIITCILFFLVYYIRRQIKPDVVHEGLMPGTYIKVTIGLKMILTVNVAILLFAWLYPFDVYLNVYQGPSGDGLTSYVSETDNPKLSVETDGAFIYKVASQISQMDMMDIGMGDIMGSIEIRLYEPTAHMTVIPFTSGRLIMNFTNYSITGHTMRINGQKINPIAHQHNFDTLSESYSTDEMITNFIGSGSLQALKGYYVVLDVEANEVYDLEIIPENMNDGVFEFYAISDIHGGINVIVPLLESFLSEEIDFIVANGDLVNNGEKSEYMLMSKIFNTYPTPIYTTIGNHDIWGPGSQHYGSYFGPTNYSFVYEHATFIMINTASGILGESQLEWLEEELKSATTELIFVVGHISPIDTISGDFDSELNINPELNHSIQSKAESDRLLELCNNHHVDYFIAGHSHVIGSKEVGGTKFITSGVLGGNASAHHDIGYLKISVNGNEVTVTPMDSSEYYKEGILKRLQTIQVFLIPLLRGKSLSILITLLVICTDYILWLFFKPKYVFKYGKPSL